MAHPQHIGHIVDKLSDPHNHDAIAYLVFANLGKAGGAEVADALLKNLRIRKINLSKNHLDGMNIIPFLEAFHTLPKLESLDLSANPLGSAGVKLIFASVESSLVLRTLDLSQTILGEQAAPYIAEFLKKSQSVYHLFLHNNDFNPASMMLLSEGLKLNHALRSLTLSHNPLGDAGLMSLATAIQAHPNLEKISLSNTQIGDAGIKALALACSAQQTITHLDLNLNQISDKSLQHLAEFITQTTSLHHLDLQQNRFSNKGVKLLLTALESNRSIWSMHLSGNGIDSGLLQEIEARLAYNRSVEALYHELQQLQKRADAEALPVHKQYLYNKSAPLAYRLTQEKYRDSAKILKVIHHRLGRLAATNDPVAAWNYLMPLQGAFNDIHTLLIRTMVTFAKQSNNQAFYEKALLLMRENGEPHNIEAEILDVVIGILTSRQLLAPDQLKEISGNLQQLIGAEKVVTMNNLVAIANRVGASLDEKEKTPAFIKVCLQPGYVTADEVDAFLRFPVVRKECLHQFGTANLVTYEHLLICPEATALNHVLRFVAVKNTIAGFGTPEKDLAHFTLHQTRIEQAFADAIGQHEETIQKALHVFYDAALQEALDPQEKYQVILEIYENKWTLSEKIIDMLNYLVVYCQFQANDPWACSQLERVLTTSIGENIEKQVMIERMDHLAHVLLGRNQLTRWQTRRLALLGHIEKPSAWQKWSPWHIWRRLRLDYVLRKADRVMDAKERFRLVSGYLRLV